jgi:hypothetical protein
MRGLENVLKDAPNVFPRALVRIETQRSMAEVQRTNVIETKNVIRMAVRDENRVEMPETDSQSLLPEIAGGVDDDRLSGVLN